MARDRLAALRVRSFDCLIKDVYMAEGLMMFFSLSLIRLSSKVVRRAGMSWPLCISVSLILTSLSLSNSYPMQSTTQSPTRVNPYAQQDYPSYDNKDSTTNLNAGMDSMSAFYGEVRFLFYLSNMRV